MTAGIEGMAGYAAASDGPPAGTSSGTRPRSRNRLLVPLALATGWGMLIGYSTVLLTHEAPLRPDVTAEQASTGEPGPFEIPQELSVPVRGRAPWSDASNTLASQRTQAAVPPEESVAQAAPVLQRTALHQDQDAVTSAPTAAVAVPPPSERAPFVGVWGPTDAACKRGARRRGFLPARITENGARAGTTFCSFRDSRRVGNGWNVAAACSDGGRRWSSQVRLLVDGDRLKWSSAKGDASYVRCGRRDG